VATADANSDGRVDVVTGAGPSGGPHVRALDAITLSSLDELFAFDPAFGGEYTSAATDSRRGRPPSDVTQGTLPEGFNP
jgi:hypothetical protein